MKNYNKVLLLILCSVFLNGNFLIAQSKMVDSLLTSFVGYSNVPQELIHLHLNKSILMQGEDLGFTSYIQNKKTKRASLDTKNLYVQLINSNDKVVKEQLVLVENGRYTGTIFLDSTVTQDTYKVRAFTNWMKNFERPDFFETYIKVLDPYSNISELTSSETEILEYDIQMMPESGRAVDNVFTEVGLLVKNQHNRGVSVKGKIYRNGIEITDVSTNELGLGRFTWLPDSSSVYLAKFEIDGQVITKVLPDISLLGMSMSVNEVNHKIYVDLNTNESTLKNISGSTYYLGLHGTSEMKIYNVRVDELKTSIPIAASDLNKGINQFILFDANRKIINERLYYNYDESTITNSSVMNAQVNLDSVKIDLNIKDIAWTNDGSVSISVLPGESIATIADENIINSFELKPFINGTVENASYYFTNINRRTKRDMDNLLICQGWKIYDWDNVFDINKEYNNSFEVGILAEMQLKNDKFDNFLMYSGRFSQSRIIDNVDGDKFYVADYFPFTQERLRLSGIGSFGKAKKLQGTPTFYPSAIPDFDYERNSFNSFNPPNTDDMDLVLLPFVNGNETLETIVVNADKNEGRRKEVSRIVRGRMYFLTDQDRRSVTTFDHYLNRIIGLKAVYNQGELTVELSGRGIGMAGNIRSNPILELDGVVYNDFNPLIGLNASIIDYVEVGFDSFGGPPGSQGGYVRIKTDPLLNPYESNRKDFSEFKIPLVFESPSRFYTPQYFDYNGDFFNKLGVIDWKGNVQIDDNGNASFTVPYVGQDSMIINVQGWNEDGQLLYDQQKVEVKK